MPPQDDDQAQRTLQGVEAELRAERPRLRFRPAVELDYLVVSDVAKSRNFQRFAIACLVLYNLFLLTDLMIVPDVFSRAVIMHLCVVTPLAALGIILARQRPHIAEPMAAGLLMLILLCGTMLFAWSRAPDAPLLAFAFPLILMAGNVLVPLRFDLAMGTTLVGAGGVVAAVLGHGGYSDGARWFTLQVVLAMAAFGLFIAYRLDASARLAYLLRRRDDLQSQTRAKQDRQITDASDFDVLTGLGSRSYFDTTLERLWREALPGQRRVGLLVIGLDYFQLLTEQHGEDAGDRCLLLVADVLREHTRTGDYATHYGGGKFAILLPGAPLHAAQAVAERMRVATEALVVVLGERAAPGAISISVGCACVIPRESSTSAELIAGAEAALDAANQKGRNRIHPPAPTAA